MPADSFNPIKHLRRASALRDNHIAERIEALAGALTSKQIAQRLNISRAEVEQIAARNGFGFNDPQQEEA